MLPSSLVPMRIRDSCQDASLVGDPLNGLCCSALPSLVVVLAFLSVFLIRYQCPSMIGLVAL